MRVRGNMASTQSSIDFYLKLSSLGNIKTIEDLRDHYFNIFLNEERSQANLLLQEKRKLEERKASELKEISKLENGNLNLDNRTEDIVDDIFSSSFFSEEGEVKDVSYDDSDIFSSDFFSEEVSNSDKQYVSHGIYLEDVDLSSDSEVSDATPPSIKANEGVITPSQGYVEHGVFLDDVISKRVDEDDSTFEGFEEVEDTSESIIEDVEDESFEDNVFEGFEDEEVLEDTEDDVFEGFEEEDNVFEDIEEEEFTEGVDEEDNTFEGFEGEEITSEESDIFEDIEEEELFEDTEENEEVFEESEDVTEFNEIENTDIVEEPEDSLPSLEVSKVEEPLEIPNDIRVFLRQHPNSDISYVSQFYPMKEINRQVKLGRIYKKKGKLLI